jgi:L-aminopeptidase/D-esterase-like protein
MYCISIYKTEIGGGTNSKCNKNQGVEVGHTTLISGEGKLIMGEGPIRTGVTAILPRGKKSADRVFAGWFSQNGNGEMTGTTWVEESGLLEGPVMITNTHSVGIVRDSVIEWQVKRSAMGQHFALPVVAETYDGFLNDINGFHVTKSHVYEAIEIASTGPVIEGSIGGGTGMICFEFKGGIGTASRKVQLQSEEFNIGVLVQANFGKRDHLQIAGVPVGMEIRDHLILPRIGSSIIIVIATDAPILPHQLKRLARRASLGLGKVGAISSNFSGDIFLAFSTANPGASNPSEIVQISMIPNDQMDPVFEAVVQSTEEAIINAMIASDTMFGRDGNKVIGLPHDQLKEALTKYKRLLKTAI